MPNLIPLEKIYEANKRLKGIINKTPLHLNSFLSKKYGANVFLKREDFNIVRSYKIRGAYNKISALTKTERDKGLVCASAGNHSQGFALSCKLLKTKGVIFMPTTTPKQKIEKAKSFGEGFIDINIVGDTFDESYEFAKGFSDKKNRVFIHPFDDEKIIQGHASVGLEILSELKDVDYLIFTVGGGGLGSGLISVFKQLSPKTKLVGIEPATAPSMLKSLKEKKVVTLKTISNFVDGAAVKRVGEITFKIFKDNIDKMFLADEGMICSYILDLYNNDGIVVEPAGATSLCALSQLNEHEIANKNIVCVIGGGNNDITRMEEIKERAMLYEGKKHYYVIQLPQRAGALKELLIDVIGEKIDITFFEYQKKNQRETGPIVIGIEIEKKEDYIEFKDRLKKSELEYDYLNKNNHYLKLLL